MDNKKAPSPFAVLWGWASGEHGGFYASVALAVLGVAGSRNRDAISPTVIALPFAIIYLILL